MHIVFLLTAGNVWLASTALILVRKIKICLRTTCNNVVLLVFSGFQYKYSDQSEFQSHFFLFLSVLDLVSVDSSDANFFFSFKSSAFPLLSLGGRCC